MSGLDLFFDSSALFAGIVSASGASRALLLLAEAGQVSITVSEQVVAETERVVARKIPRALSNYREALRATGLRIVGDPSPKEIEVHKDIISHQADVPIVVAAMQVQADYLVTLNRRHFVDDPNVGARSGLRIGPPGDALAWVRERLTQTKT
jgi:predicted nucleic acid-binding protein